MTPPRAAIRAIHPVAGAVALATILAFWSATLLSELFCDHAAVLMVKTAILYGLAVLIPALATTGASGMRLAGRSGDPRIAAKRRRMPVIAANGVLVLVPCAIFLQGRAAAGLFDGVFYAVQALEIAAGALNITLFGLSFRDGLALAACRRGPKPA